MSDGVICLKASGNAIEDTALHFKVGKDFWLELTDKPATTKEEKAARAIEDYLRQHGEATRKQLIGLALEIGLAENQTTASKLVDRVIDRLVTKIRKEYRGRELVLHWQGGRATSPASLLDGDPLGSPNQPEPDPLATAEVSGDQPDDENQTPPDPQDSPDRPTDPQGGLKTTTTDMEFVYGVYRQEATVDNVDIVDKVDNDRLVYGVYNSQPDQTDPLRRLTPKTNPISVSNVYNPDSPEGDPLAAQPETEGSPEGDLQGDPLNEEELWGWFTPERLKPSARAQTEGSPTRPDQSESDQRECPEPTDIPTEPERSEPDRQANPPAIPASEHEGSPTEPDRPATCLNIAEGGIEFIRINSISETSPSERVGSPQDKPSAQAQSEVSPPDLPASEPVIETPLLSPDLPTDEPEVSPPDEPVATLTERICPFCGEKLEPDQSGLATCAGCGRLFEVEIPPDSPDDDSDDGDDETPPESPDGDGSPPQAPNNGHDGSRQIGFTPPKDFAIPPAFQPKRIYSHKLNSPAILNRITVRQSDGSIKLVWQDKKKKTKPETVAPDDLNDWQPIEEIPAIDLPNIESVKIPPTVVLDIETTDKDPQQGRILAAGLALFVEGKEVETLIIDSDNGERNLLVEVFDYLHATCDRLGEFILTGYNLFDFDLTYLIERAAKRNVKRQCPFYYYTDRNGNVVRWKVATTEGTLKRDPLDYNAILVDRDLPIRIVDTQHLVCRWDYTAKQLIHYDLKSVAEHFTVNIPDRPVLSHKQIVHDYYHNRPRFNAYLLADLRETYALFAKLIPPYVGVAALTELPLEKVAVKSTAWVWQQILERYYNGSPQPDEKRDYEGGLVVSRKGLWSPCLKLDIASLYPTIMLAYRIHSRKDTDQIALRWLKTLTQQRLVLKAKAKAGDPNAQILQEAMKILLNSLYGFYGTGGYGFNDMTAAERVTEIGRKVLTCMIAAIEDLGGIIVEADTDGLIVCYRNADPQEILQAVSEAIPPVFKVEVEWLEATVFVSDDKNYVVIDRNGKIETVKGSKWRGRDKPAYARKAIPTFLQKWVTQGKEAALNYAKQVLCEIRNGQGWHWVVQTHRVGEDDTNFIRAGFKVGERAIFAYKVKRKTQKDSEIAKSPDEGYDIQFYSDKFSDLIEEVIEVIDPAQIEAWREIVSQQARPLFFGAK
jgi:DNA polymerase elongation subunit (family B)